MLIFLGKTASEIQPTLTLCPASLESKLLTVPELLRTFVRGVRLLNVASCLALPPPLQPATTPPPPHRSTHTHTQLGGAKRECTGYAMVVIAMLLALATCYAAASVVPAQSCGMAERQETGRWLNTVMSPATFLTVSVVRPKLHPILLI